MTVVLPGAAEQATDLGDVADDLAACALALARRFWAGGTLWCVSPTWPHHARHVAVEFVHPVIMGKRALPAVMVPSEDLVATLRVSVRPGDVVLAVATRDDRQVQELMRRADPWGIETVWVGNGPRPDAGAADHVLWLPDDDLAAYTGRFILLYHLLWELCHVCFEHSGLLAQEPQECEGEVCITCSDEGRLGEVIAPRDAERAFVRTATGHETVDTSLVGDVAPGDLLLIHAGSAISLVDA